MMQYVIRAGAVHSQMPAGETWLSHISRDTLVFYSSRPGALIADCAETYRHHLCYQWNFTPPVEIKPRAKCTSKQLGEADELVFCFNINQTRIDAEVMKCLPE